MAGGDLGERARGRSSAGEHCEMSSKGLKDREELFPAKSAYVGVRGE